jgi:hypothetical protein
VPRQIKKLRTDETPRLSRGRAQIDPWILTFAHLLPICSGLYKRWPLSIGRGHLRYIHHQGCLFVNPTDPFGFGLSARITNIESSVSTWPLSDSLSLSLRISVKTRAGHIIGCFPLETQTLCFKMIKKLLTYKSTFSCDQSAVLPGGQSPNLLT